MSPHDKLCSPAKLVARMATLPKPWGFTNGVFDVLHGGHVTYLHEAGAACGTLIVALNTDRSAKALGKGPDRPLNKLKHRALVVAGMAPVTVVTHFDEATPVELIKQLKPDLYFKGSDYDIEDLEETRVVRSWGGEAKALAFQNGYSTTAFATRAQSAQPHKLPKPRKTLDPHNSLRVVWSEHGWIPADRASTKIAADRGLMHDGVESLGYFFKPRNKKQWGKIHKLCEKLAENVDELAGITSHDVLKKLQLDSGVGCELERLDLPPPLSMTIERKIAKSFAFGFMDDGEFMEIYRGLAQYILRTERYFSALPPETQTEIAKLMPPEPQA